MDFQALDLVFFFYGLAFFSMGLAMMLEAGRSPLIDETRALRFLSGFGFLHGFHEWLELYLLNNPELFLISLPTLGWIRLGLLIISFTLLLIFALLSLRPQRMTFRKTMIGLVSILIFFGIALVLDYALHTHNTIEALQHVDVLARYTLGVVGAALACVALVNQGRRANVSGRSSLAYPLFSAGLGFGLYSLTQLVVSRQAFLPASWLNTSTFMDITGVPIQAFRALTAVLITVSLIRAIQIGDSIRKQELVNVQESRLEVYQQLQNELEERERLRQEVMRHTVIVQEEERTRIARELHDETAQVLTAFKLHLASLEQGIDRNCAGFQQVGQLKNLCSQMSESLYRLVHDLRPAQLDDLGLVPAMEYLIKEIYDRTGMKASLVVRGPRQRPDSLVETVVFRVSQEALWNIVRHAGVKTASIELIFSPEEIRLEVSDQGCGFDPSQAFLPPRGFGLAAMRERVEAVGGEFEVISAPGAGARLVAHFPQNVQLGSKTSESLKQAEAKRLAV